VRRRAVGPLTGCRPIDTPRAHNLKERAAHAEKFSRSAGRLVVLEASLMLPLMLKRTAIPKNTDTKKKTQLP